MSLHVVNLFQKRLLCFLSKKLWAGPETAMFLSLRGTSPLEKRRPFRPGHQAL